MRLRSAVVTPIKSWLHTCLPQNCVFRNTNHQNPKHSIIFRNTPANVSPHLWTKSSYQILGKIKGNLHCAPPFHISWSRPTVHQSNRFTTVLWISEFKQMSPFSSMVMKGHFSCYAFLNIWKRLLFTGDIFAGVRSVDLAMLSFAHETFLQMVQQFQRSYWLAASQMRCSLQETSEKLLLAVCLSCICRALPGINLHICLLCMCNASNSGFSKFQYKSFGYSLEKLERLCLFVVFPEWQNPELWEAICISKNALLILWFSVIFRNKHGGAVTVGMYEAWMEEGTDIHVFFSTTCTLI